MLDGSLVQLGDIAIALSSSGVHSNGFSLVRKIVSELSEHTSNWHTCPELLGGRSLGEVLLTPTKIYVKPVLEARRTGLEIHGMAHITGGGLPENLPRCLSPGQSVKINTTSWVIPPIFEWLAQAGQVSLNSMFNTFNMGIGFVLIVPPQAVEQTITLFKSQDIEAYQIVEVIEGEKAVIGIPE